MNYCLCVVFSQVGTRPDYRDRPVLRGALNLVIGTPNPQLLRLCRWVRTNPGPCDLVFLAPTYGTLLLG